MNTSASPFQTQFRPDLALKRRGLTIPPRPGSSAPFEGDPTSAAYQSELQIAWDKLYRARAILEAEQSHLRDDRIVLQGEMESVQLREQAVLVREQRMQQVELHAALALAEAEHAKGDESALARLTRAPFDMARSVFGQKK